MVPLCQFNFWRRVISDSKELESFCLGRFQKTLIGTAKGDGGF
jgi:hypothetical protein